MTRHEHEKMIRENMGLVQTVVNRAICGLPGNVEREDLVQAGRIGLARAIDLFDPQHGVQFSTYAVPWVRNNVSSEVRRAFLVRDNRPKLQMGDRVKFAPEWAADAVPDRATGPQDIAEANDTRRAILATLKPREAQVVDLHLYQDLTFREIGARLGISKQLAHYVWQRARERLQSTFRELGTVSPSEGGYGAIIGSRE